MVPIKNLSSHHQRIISGIVMLALIAGCLYFGGLPLRILLGLAGTLALWEFYQMFWPGKTHLLDKAVGFLAAICLFLPHDFPLFFAGNAMFVVQFLFFYVALRYLTHFGGKNEKPLPLSELALIIIGLIYLPLCLRMALELTLLNQLAVLLAVVASDTGAYYMGSIFGKHKIWPKVSPNKSREGALGGLAASTLLLALYGFFIYDAQVPEAGYSVFGWALSGLLLSLASQAGDFFESALKRDRGVKDSSNLIPGHGGFMDRLDSLVFALPVFIFICLPLLAAL